MNRLVLTPINKEILTILILCDQPTIHVADMPWISSRVQNWRVVCERAVDQNPLMCTMGQIVLALSRVLNHNDGAHAAGMIVVHHMPLYVFSFSFYFFKLFLLYCFCFPLLYFLILMATIAEFF